MMWHNSPAYVGVITGMDKYLVFSYDIKQVITMEYKRVLASLKAWETAKQAAELATKEARMQDVALLREKCCKGQQEAEDEPPRSVQLAVRNDEELGKLL
ncbi:hypothetical protein RJ640_013194 [Escallonia rubra]|uniref:Uncharacterized protein n=1 Tax=Escallonia rubra TaxID=112253 RepID=A0AA88QR65_9ASTE|nr:hypothetical protein RJ640_013194 [Escallonia rubra]